MSTDDAMDVESATQGLYMDVEHQSIPNAISSNASSHPVDNRQVVAETQIRPEVAESILVARRVVLSFLEDRKAGDIVPAHSRVVIVDADIRLKHAFRALLDNGVRAAPVMDLARQEFCGILSVSDILDSILHLYYSHPVEDVHYDLSRGLHEYTVRTWQQQQRRQESTHGRTPDPSFRYVDANAPLFDAVRIMRDAHMLHLPILGQDRALLHTLEHWRVLRFVHRHFSGPLNTVLPSGTTTVASDPQHATRLFSLTLSQLNIGTYSNLITIPITTPLLTCLQTLQQHDLSALPVVDEQNLLVEVYSRADTVLLSTGRCDGNTLQRTVGAVLREVRGGVPFAGATCCREDMLGTVFERFEGTGVQRLYVMGESGLEGVVSLSDLLRYFLYGY